MSIPNELSQGSGLTQQWQFPWADGLIFDEAASMLEIRSGDVVAIRLSSRNGGLLIERPEPTVMTITARMNTTGLPAGDYSFDLSVLLNSGQVFFSDSGSFTVKVSKKAVEPLPVLTSIRPWTTVYPSTAAATLTDQDEFEAELAEALRDS
jgi:hypothetical protein